jgi:acyl carrier protein
VISYSQKPPLEANTPLFVSGLIDSFGFAELLLLLEKHYQVTIPDSIKQVKYFQTLAEISKTLEALKKKQLPSHEEDESLIKARQESFLRLSHPSSKRRADTTMFEWWIIHFRCATRHFIAGY